MMKLMVLPQAMIFKRRAKNMGQARGGLTRSFGSTGG
jgi:hypothetical protein